MEAQEAQATTSEAEDREFRNARRYDGGRSPSSRGSGEVTSRTRPTTSSRSTRKTESFGDAISSVVIKELKGTTGRRIVRGILGGIFKAR